MIACNLGNKSVGTLTFFSSSSIQASPEEVDINGGHEQYCQVKSQERNIGNWVIDLFGFYNRFGKQNLA